MTANPDRSCPICGQLIPVKAKNSRRYCSDECYRVNKRRNDKRGKHVKDERLPGNMSLVVLDPLVGTPYTISRRDYSQYAEAYAAMGITVMEAK